jgi:hypothetical protein
MKKALTRLEPRRRHKAASRSFGSRPGVRIRPGFSPPVLRENGRQVRQKFLVRLSNEFREVGYVEGKCTQNRAEMARPGRRDIPRPRFRPTILWIAITPAGGGGISASIF